MPDKKEYFVAKAISDAIDIREQIVEVINGKEKLPGLLAILLIELDMSEKLSPEQMAIGRSLAQTIYEQNDQLQRKEDKQ